MAARSGVIDTSAVKGIADLHAGVMSDDPVVAPAHEVVHDSDLIVDPSMPPSHADAAPEHGGDTAATSTEDASPGDAGPAHADLAYADADHVVADVDHAYADHAYADATVPDIAFTDHSMLPADAGTPHSLGADGAKGQDDGHDAAAWWWAGGAALAGGGLGYLLTHDHHDDATTASAAATPDVHVVVESHGAFIDANGDGVYEADSEVAVFQGAGANADLASNHVTIHFNDVPGGDNNDAGALNLTGFGADDKIEFHVEAMMGDNWGGRHILDASASYLSSVDAWAGHVSYEFNGVLGDPHPSITVHSTTSWTPAVYDFSGNHYHSVYALSVDNLALNILVSRIIGDGTSTPVYANHGAIAYWTCTDSENALNQQELLFPHGTVSCTTALNMNNEGGVVDFDLARGGSYRYLIVVAGGSRTVFARIAYVQDD